MNRTLIALGVAATVALPVVAEAAPKIYGKLNLSVEQYEKEYDNPATKPDELVRLQTNDSRFGVKGEDELTATLSAVYQIEWEVLADTAGTTTDMKQRNRFIGIKSQDFGTVKLGAYDTYLKLAQGKADLFNDLYGDMKYVIAGENRANDVVAYESPKFLGGLQVNAMAQTQDGNAAGTTKNSKNGNSASIVYDNSDIGLWAALAMDNNLNYSSTPLNSTAREIDAMRLVLAYTIAGLTVSGVYNTVEDAVGTAGNEETGMTVGVAYKLGDQTIKAQYGTAEADLATASTQEKTQLSVGVDHNFNSKTRAYVFYTAKEEDKLAALADTEETSLGLGIEHNF
ncbi:MAG: porin [Pseudomonadota bacterium]